MNKKVIIFGALGVAAVAGAAYWYLGRSSSGTSQSSTPQTPIQIIASGVQSGTGFYVGTEFISAVEFNDLMTRYGRTFEQQAAIYIGRGGVQAAAMAGLGSIMLVS